MVNKSIKKLLKNFDYYLYLFSFILMLFYFLIFFHFVIYFVYFGFIEFLLKIGLHVTLREVYDTFILLNKPTSYGLSVKNKGELYQHITTFCYMEDLKYNNLLSPDARYTIIKPNNIVLNGADGILTDMQNVFTYQYKLREKNSLGYGSLVLLEDRYKTTTDVLQIAFLDRPSYMKSVEASNFECRDWGLTLKDFSYLIDKELTEQEVVQFKYYLYKSNLESTKEYHRDIQNLYDKNPSNGKSMFDKSKLMDSSKELYERVKIVELLRKDIGLPNVVPVSHRLSSSSEFE